MSKYAFSCYFTLLCTQNLLFSVWKIDFWELRGNTQKCWWHHRYDFVLLKPHFGFDFRVGISLFSIWKVCYGASNFLWGFLNSWGMLLLCGFWMEIWCQSWVWLLVVLDMHAGTGWWEFPDMSDMLLQWCDFINTAFCSPVWPWHGNFEWLRQNWWWRRCSEPSPHDSGVWQRRFTPTM